MVRLRVSVDGDGLTTHHLRLWRAQEVRHVGNLLRIDPKGLQITHRIPMSAEQPMLLAVGAGSVWTANHENYDVSKVDPEKNKVVRTIPLGSYSAILCGIAAIHGSVYVTFGETTCG